MSAIQTTSGTGPTTVNTVETQEVTTTTTKKTSGASDVADPIVTGSGNTTRPALPAPTLTAAAMMIALTALNSKVSSEAIKFGEKAMDGVRKDIQDQATQRLDHLKKYFDNLNSINGGKKCGLFGAIANFFKHAVKGDFAEAFRALTDNIGSVLKDIGQLAAVVIAIIAAVAITVGTAGAGSAVLAAAIIGAVLVVGGMAMSDPGIIDMIIESMPEDQKQQAAMALAITGAVLAIIGGVSMGWATGGASTMATISTFATVISGFINAGVTLQQGVDSYQQSEFKAGAMEGQADMDVADANMTELKSLLDRNQKDLKALFDAFSNQLSSTREMVSTYGQNQIRAATA